ncbi:MAG: hypothetical protein SCALA702_02240 [Melioribacteraceae bacterium]|nr:MAG: hypothetical protein SCALA702_02240 [Melioribacteraceae bacterium]
MREKRILFTGMAIILFVSIGFGCNDLLTDANQDNSTLTPGELIYRDLQGTWSHDGKMIAYYSFGDSVKQSGLYIIDSTGEQIHFFNSAMQLPSWSNDDSKIAFTFMPSNQIYTIEVASRVLKQVTFSGRNYFPTWSIEDDYILHDCRDNSFAPFYHLRKTSIETGVFQVLLSLPDSGDIRSPHYYDDFSKVIYSRHGSYEGSSEVFIMDTLGNELKRLTRRSGFEYAPIMSPDNKMVLFTNAPTMNSNIVTAACILNLETNSLFELTEYNSEACDWSPDGQGILIADMRIDKGNLVVIDLAGNVLKEVTKPLKKL